MKKYSFHIFMSVGFLVSLAAHLTGVAAHKVIGLLTLILFVCHICHHRRWYFYLGRGEYTPTRRLNTFVNLSISLGVVGIAVSGVLLSKELAAGLVGSTPGRLLHILSTALTGVGLALHAAFHFRRKNS